MQPETYKKFLKDTLLPILDTLRVQGKGVFLNHAGGIEIETADALLKAYWSGLPEAFRRRFDFDPKADSLIDNPELIIALQENISNLLAVSEKDFEKKIEVYHLRQIKALYDLEKERQEEAGKERESQISQVRSQAKEHVRRLEQYYEGLKDTLTEELGLPEETAKKILVEAKQQTLKELEEVGPKDLYKTLENSLLQTIKTHEVPVEEERFKHLHLRLNSPEMEERFTEAVDLVVRSKEQKERIKHVYEEERRIVDAGVRGCLAVVVPDELWENQEFTYRLLDWARKGDFSKVTNYQEFLEEGVKTAIQKAGIKQIGGEEITPTKLKEVAKEIAKAAVEHIPLTLPELFRTPRVSPLPSPAPVVRLEAEKALKDSLEKHLGGIDDQVIYDVSFQLERRVQKAATTILPLETKEEKAAHVSESLISLFKERGLTLPKEEEVMKSVVQEILPSLSSPTIEQEGVLTQVAEESLRKHLEEPIVSEEKRTGLASYVLDELAQEERLYSFFALKKDEEKSGLVEQLFLTLSQEAKISLPEEKKSLYQNIAQEVLPKLVPFLKGEKKAIENLKKIDEAPALSFTTMLPGPLKPLGLVFDAIGAVFPKVKDALLVGFFGDKKEIRKTKRNLVHVLRETRRKADFEKQCEGKSPEFIKLNNKVSGLKNTLQVLSQMEKMIKKPSFLERPFIRAGNFLRKASSFLDKKFPHPLSIFSRIKNIDFSKFFPPFFSSLSANVRRLAGSFLHQYFPHFFLKDAAGKLVFKFSFAGLKTRLGNFFSRALDFFRQQILGSSLIQGIFQKASLFGSNLLTKLGLGGLAKLGFRGIMGKALSFGGQALSLGFKALKAGITGGLSLLWEGGKLVFNFFKGLPSLFSRFFGFGERGDEIGGAGGVGVLTFQNIDSSILIALVLVAAPFFLALYTFFSTILKGGVFRALPFGFGR